MIALKKLKPFFIYHPLHINPKMENTDCMTTMFESLKTIVEKQAQEIAELKEELKQSRLENLNRNDEMKEYIEHQIDLTERNIHKINYERAMEAREIRAEMREKNNQCDVLMRPFSRETCELAKIRHNIVPEVEKLVAFMKQNPEYQRFYDEACQEEFYK